MFFEYWWSRREGRVVHKFSDGLTRIGCGIFTVTLALFAKAGLLVLFALVSAHGLWLVAMVIRQLGEEYNLTTALRQGAFQDISHWPLYLGLAVLGCPAEVFILRLTFSKFYQFWIYTRLIGNFSAN